MFARQVLPSAVTLSGSRTARRLHCVDLREARILPSRMKRIYGRVSATMSRVKGWLRLLIGSHLYGVRSVLKLVFEPRSSPLPLVQRMISAGTQFDYSPRCFRDNRSTASTSQDSRCAHSCSSMSKFHITAVRKVVVSASSGFKCSQNNLFPINSQSHLTDC